jgi:hypothetical protein
MKTVTQDFPIITMGRGEVEVGDATHEGKPALWFGRGGRGLDAPPQDINRPAHDGETLALFVFEDPRGIPPIEYALRRVRSNMRPEPKTFADITQPIIDEIDIERLRHQLVEGYSLAHDDEHDRGELVNAAVAYALAEQPDHAGAEEFWPFDDGFKPKDHRRNLIRAAALLVAEIERLDRAAKKAKPA